MFILKVIETFQRNNIDYTVTGAVAAALHGYVQNVSYIEFVVANTPEALGYAEVALAEIGLQLKSQNASAMKFENPENSTEQVILYTHLDVADCKSISKSVYSYKIPVMTIHELQKKFEFQIQNRALMSPKAFLLKPLEILQILEDYRSLEQQSLAHKKDKSILISIKIPQSLLESFKSECSSSNVKYQTQIKKLMKDWLA